MRQFDQKIGLFVAVSSSNSGNQNKLSGSPLRMTFVTVTYRSADEDQVNKSIRRTNYMRRETASKSYYLGERAIVVGGGLAGLSAARALSDRFRQIVILDRDELPDGATPRHGVPQGKHPHGLLGGG
jgi:NAD(P)-binding Rossmann-like domain